MDSFTLSLLVFIITAVMGVYFATARRPVQPQSEAHAQAPLKAPLSEPRAGPAAAVEFVFGGQAREHRRLHPVLRQNVAVTRLMQMEARG